MRRQWRPGNIGRCGMRLSAAQSSGTPRPGPARLAVRSAANPHKKAWPAVSVHRGGIHKGAHPATTVHTPLDIERTIHQLARYRGRLLASCLASCTRQPPRHAPPTRGGACVRQEGDRPPPRLMPRAALVAHIECLPVLSIMARATTMLTVAYATKGAAHAFVHVVENCRTSQRYLKFQLPRAAASSFCVGYPRMALIPPRLRSV